MARSMTAFARVVEALPKKGKWTLEFRSLNHRYLDLSLRLPPSLGSLENSVRELIQSQVLRGKVSLSIAHEIESEAASRLVVNEELAASYLRSLKKIQKKMGLSGDLTLNDLIRIPGIFSVDQEEQNAEKLWPEIRNLIKKLLKKATDLKEEEGKKLSSDIALRLGNIGKAVSRIAEASEGRSKQIFAKLKEKVDALIGASTPQDERFYREVAFIAERGDLTEEIVRLRSHLDLFKSRLKTDSEVGRELDFLCQEMNREANTMGSKSQLFEISTEVVFIKGELEKIREQVQNIE